MWRPAVGAECGTWRRAGAGEGTAARGTEGRVNRHGTDLPRHPGATSNMIHLPAAPLPPSHTPTAPTAPTAPARRSPSAGRSGSR